LATLTVSLVTIGGALASGQLPAGAATPPPESFSFYGSTVNQTSWYDLGETFGTDVGDGTFPSTTLVVIEFGAPDYSGGDYGVCLAGSDPCSFATISSALAAVEQFGAGFYADAPSTAETFLALGSTNYGTWFNGSDADAYDFGKTQANEVNNGNTYFQGQGFGTEVEMRGGMDAEPGWGTFPLATEWADGYDATADYLYWDDGSADGCPTSGSGSCDNGWSQTDVYDMAWGFSEAEPLPQIYSATLASQWGTIVNEAGSMTFLGPVSQHQACADQGDACTGLDYTPNQAWNQLYADLNCGTCVDPQTPPHVTNIRWDLSE
jgi:hypothetical protein